MKDWAGNKKSVFSTIGAMGHSKEERQNEDFYATDPIAIDKLEKSGIFDIPRKVWECSCGQGHLSERLKEYGHEVFSTDIVDRNYGEKIVDFLSFEADNFFDEIGGVDCIITNPPYKYTTDFVLQALRLLKSGYACFLLKTTALESRGRYEKIFRNYPPLYVLQFIDRILCAKNGDFEYSKKFLGGGAQAYAWFVWEKGFKGRTTLDWI